MGVASPPSPSHGRLVARPELHQLAVFLTVVETRSFAGAAHLLGRTPPAVRQAIGRLEDLYSGDLFERRRGAGLTLTPIGEAILPLARTIIAAVDQQMARASQTARSETGELRLGFFPGIATGPLRTGLAGFLATSPSVRVRLVEGFPGELHRRLNERELDLIVAGLMPELGSAMLTQERLWDERLFAALPASHPLADLPSISWQNLILLPIILPTHQGELSIYRTIVEHVGGRHFDHELHEVSRAALLDLVGIGLGATVVLESAVLTRDDVSFRPIAGPHATARIDAIWPAADRNPLRHHLLTFLRSRHNTLGGAAFTGPLPAPGSGRD